MLTHVKKYARRVLVFVAAVVLYPVDIAIAVGRGAYWETRKVIKSNNTALREAWKGL